MSLATINGARLWYDDWGGSGEPILFHHGYTASRVNWMPVAERLRDRYRVLLMECRGTGESEHTADGYNIPQYASDVVGMLDHIGLERVTYAGHSMGGGIGFWLGLEYPQRLNRLVLMAPVPADGVGEIPAAYREEMLRQRAEGDRAAMMRQYVAQRVRPEVETDAWFESRIDHVLGVSDGHYIQSMESMQALRVGDRLGELTAPTLVIAGAADGLLRANLNDFQRLPNATLHVLSRVGHEVAVQAPDAVAAAIDDFMQHGVVTAQTVMARARG
jgi:pimeloyl-ACP methyl ester carboxylesterase